MTTRTHKFGKYTAKAYKKTVGKGWEIGLSFAGKTIFTGNFIHAKEANAWWAMMNSETTRFFRRYAIPTGASTTFFCRFMTNYMYKMYYAFLNRQFTKYNRGYAQALKKDERRYTHMRKHTGTNNWTRRAA